MPSAPVQVLTSGREPKIPSGPTPTRNVNHTTMRAVATQADIALIYHHFHNKSDLPTVALTVPERAQPNLPMRSNGRRSSVASPSRRFGRA